MFNYSRSAEAAFPPDEHSIFPESPEATNAHDIRETLANLRVAFEALPREGDLIDQYKSNYSRKSFKWCIRYAKFLGLKADLADLIETFGTGEPNLTTTASIRARLKKLQRYLTTDTDLDTEFPEFTYLRPIIRAIVKEIRD
jgi:hypothetical protein